MNRRVRDKKINEFEVQNPPISVDKTDEQIKSEFPPL